MTAAAPVYPERGSDRSRWIEGLRPARGPVDLFRPAGAFVEEERAPSGELVTVATLLLAGAECPWRCLMCDLWKQTAPGPTPPGALVRQIDAGLADLSGLVGLADGVGLAGARWLKLYNAGSFFDRAAVPPGDLPEIAERARRFERLVVECHPSLAGEGVLRFRDLLGATALEVAMGLETIHPVVLPRLNKRMPPELFERAASFLARNGIAVRAFVLCGLPFTGREESVAWAVRSVTFAFRAGASAVTVIPTRPGNGALDRLEREGLFRLPDLAMLEEVFARSPRPEGCRLFVDTWDLAPFASCPDCFGPRKERLEGQNRLQEPLPAAVCRSCG